MEHDQYFHRNRHCDCVLQKGTPWMAWQILHFVTLAIHRQTFLSALGFVVEWNCCHFSRLPAISVECFCQSKGSFFLGIGSTWSSRAYPLIHLGRFEGQRALFFWSRAFEVCMGIFFDYFVCRRRKLLSQLSSCLYDVIFSYFWVCLLHCGGHFVLGPLILFSVLLLI